MKKLLSVILTALLLVTLATTNASAKSNTISVSSKYDTKYVTVTVKCSGQFSNFGLTVNYDKTKLTLVSFGDGVVGNTETGFVSFASATDKTGTMFTVKFRKAKACGTASITLAIDEFQNAAGEDVVISGTKGGSFQTGTHNYAWTTTTEATHYEVGAEAGKCIVCGAKTTREIPVIEHTFDTKWLSDATGHWHECECGEKNEFAAHTLVWVTDKEAAVGVEGSKHQECSVCGYKGATETIPALEPTPVEPEPSNIGLYIGIAAGVVVAAGAIYYFIILGKKRKKD